MCRFSFCLAPIFLNNRCEGGGWTFYPPPGYAPVSNPFKEENRLIPIQSTTLRKVFKTLKFNFKGDKRVVSADYRLLKYFLYDPIASSSWDFFRFLTLMLLKVYNYHRSHSNLDPGLLFFILKGKKVIFI